jgi:hypothetical protein
LNYDEMILLDAEELGEGSIGALYKQDVVPLLQKHVATPAEIVEDLDSEIGSYQVTSHGKPTGHISRSQTPVVWAPTRQIDGQEGR